MILDVGGAIQQTIKRKNYKLQNEDGTHNSNAYYSSGYKNNILQLIYAEAEKQATFTISLPLSIASNRSISDDGGKII